VIRLDQGDVDGARSDIALAASQFPEFAGLVYAIGRVHLLSQRPTEAAVAFERYLGVNPGDANALFYAAFAANQLGNREQALEYLNRMQGVEGQSVRLLWLRAKTLLAAGEHGAAEMLLRDAVAVDEPPVQLVLLAQEALLRLGRTEAALALVQKALATRPDSRDLLAAEARLQFAVGDAESAEATGRKLFQRDPEDVDALLLLAQAAAGRGEADPVLLLRLRRAQERVPGDLRIPLLLGELNAAADDIPVACAALMDALRLDPTAAPVIRRLQQLRCAAVDPELIQEVYRELMASHPREVRALPALLAMDGGDASAAGALDRLERAVAADPDNTALRAGLVGALLRAGQPEAAQAALETLPAAQLRDPAILLAQGLVALARDDTRGAVRAFEDLVAARPADPEPVLLLAEAEARDGDVLNARYHFIDGLRLAPRHPLAPAVASRLFAADTAPEARRRLVDDIRRHAPGSPLFEPLQAQILLDAGRPDEAAELYRAMHARQPDNPRLFDRLLKTLVAAGRHEQALALAEPWAERHPEAAGVALTLGDLYAEAGDDARAGDWYRRVLELAPNNLFALNNLAVILTDSDPSAAAALAERAWRQQPRQPQVLDTYGAALLALGDVARARELLSDAFSYSGGDPGIALNLARALAAGGDSERAREVLRPLLHRDFRQQAEARALMMQLGAR
jgi:putative PEP-CTERM system TPR-repeat lipoprotein